MPSAQQLGRYQLLDRIAFGGMAEVYRAKTFDDSGREHLVAVKRVLNHLTTDEDFLRMLVDEAKISALLRHDHIARVYEFSHSGGEYFMAMEYVDGKDLRSVLERHRQHGRPLPPEHAAFIALCVAEGLQVAHTQRDGAGRSLQIVHRDVSPSNVLLSYSGQVKLCDFGIAKATLTRVQTRTGVIKGKVKYMSPEQAMGRKLDHRSDLFSLGTVLYEMLTLEAPFVAATEVELIFAVRDARKREAKELVPDLPDALDFIVNKAMARARSQRFQNAADLAAALRTFLGQYRPDYRPSMLSRHLRPLFAKEIDKELRLLEEYVIPSADPAQVGENLIADALGENAPYTKFTAAVAASGGSGLAPRDASRIRTGNFPRLQTPSPLDLHAEPTRILARPNPVAPEGAPSDDPGASGAGDEDLHQRGTMIFRARDGAIEAARPGELHEPATKDRADPPSALIHSMATQIIRPAEPVAKSGSSGASRGKGRAQRAATSFSSQADTRAPTTPERGRDRPPSVEVDASMTLPEQDVSAPRGFAEDDATDPSHTHPLDDDDLEPL